MKTLREKNLGKRTYRPRIWRPVAAVIAAACLAACAGAGAAGSEAEALDEPIARISSETDWYGPFHRYSSVSYLSPAEAAAWDEELRELAAESISSPNTLIGTDSDYIYYLNGRRVDLTRPSVALTYDDGPRADKGNRIMDVMAAYGARATFFINGVAVHLYPEEIRRMQAEGHEIGNHSYNHPDMSKLGPEDIDFQVGATNRAVEAETGVSPSIMRVPYGAFSDTIFEYVDMPLIQWTVDTLDWETDDAEATVAAVVGHIRDGDIVLMHEPYMSTAEAAETLVPTLIERGYQLVTVSELAAIKGVTMESGEIYYAFW